MKIELDIMDRLRIMADFVPKKVNIIEGVSCRKIIDKMILTDNEIKKWKYKAEIVNDSTNHFWDKDNDVITEFDFSSSEVEIMKSQINKMDKEKSFEITSIDLAIRIRDLKE